MLKKYRWGVLLLILVLSVEWSYNALNHDRNTARKFANKLFSYPLPPKTEITAKGFDYEVLYEGEFLENEDSFTVVAYVRLSSKLSEKELIDYYKRNHDGFSDISPLKSFEVQFERSQEIQEGLIGKKTWYKESNLSKKNNEGNPIELIVQVRNMFDSNLEEFACS
ncbi:hypothetical protein [Priestia endophytica]|jgi:hypothetical protein|uniref:hypothetical protein n=1 Tax=Priestia endophytica TaxID=135735 RepID=UPI000F529535|nr:hypothetical protein [Priestia endophytica]RPK14753.1 hypothetical protein FH5_00188 [Priestia endophytica]